MTEITGAKALIPNDSRELLFLRRTVPLPDGSVWDIPGGRAIGDETPVDTLRREVPEETGLEIAGTPELVARQRIELVARGITVVRHTFLAAACGRLCVGSGRDPEHEHGEYMSVDAALRLRSLDPYVRDVIASLPA